MAHSITITDEQFEILFNAFPYDPVLQAEACREALYDISIPNPIGYTRTGIRMYQDLYGFVASGYTLVHWEDAKHVSWCLNNGYYEVMPESEKPIEWVEDPERDRLLSIRATLIKWAY